MRQPQLGTRRRGLLDAGCGCFSLLVMLLAVSQSTDSKRGPQYAEQFFDALHFANSSREPVTLHFAKWNGETGLLVRCSSQLGKLVNGQLAASYPESTIERVDEKAISPKIGDVVFQSTLRLTPDLYAIRRSSEFWSEQQLTQSPGFWPR